MRNTVNIRKKLTDALTELRQRLAELETSEIQYLHVAEIATQITTEWETTFNSIADMVSIHDDNYGLAKVNDAFAAAFGKHPVDLIGKLCYKVVHGTRKPCPDCPHERTLASGQPCTVELYEPRLKLHLDISTSPVFDDKNRVIGSVHIMKEITDRKRAEEERLQKEKLQAVLDMAGAACHELNQPLQAIMGYAELLVIEVSEEDESPQKLLRRIREQVARMAHITRKLNNITRYRVRDYLDDVNTMDLDEASGEVHAEQAPQRVADQGGGTSEQAKERRS